MRDDPGRMSLGPLVGASLPAQHGGPAETRDSTPPGERRHERHPRQRPRTGDTQPGSSRRALAGGLARGLRGPARSHPRDHAGRRPLRRLALCGLPPRDLPAGEADPRGAQPVSAPRLRSDRRGELHLASARRLSALSADPPAAGGRGCRDARPRSRMHRGVALDRRAAGLAGLRPRRDVAPDRRGDACLAPDGAHLPAACTRLALA